VLTRTEETVPLVVTGEVPLVVTGEVGGLHGAIHNDCWQAIEH